MRICGRKQSSTVNDRETEAHKYATLSQLFSLRTQNCYVQSQQHRS